MTMEIPLQTARAMAEKVLQELRPFCVRAEIAGSIRRGRPVVHDLDFVLIPRDKAGLLERCKRNCTVLAEGEFNLLLRMKIGVDLDIFMARPDAQALFDFEPSNFGSLLLCRTGSKEHNIHLCQVAQRRGLSWNPYWGVYRGHTCIACAEEEDVFRALDISYVKPEARER